MLTETPSAGCGTPKCNGSYLKDNYGYAWKDQNLCEGRETETEAEREENNNQRQKNKERKKNSGL